jgi:hypothetical protein
MDKPGIIRARKENFAIVKAMRTLPGAFANIDDGREITVIIDQSKIDEKNVIEIQRDYKLITFDMVLEFSLVGFLAKISTALAEKKIPIFAVSAYSTDHILVHKDHLDKAIEKLQKLGFEVK